ncbi:uncharacterized protein V1510DRAFT_437085 [Dipodascopsis tothii]|uniref:uncharacterized protein n=1 Tax=Dipodascopsis tothii TaxID=44089 RepID=UPI0034CDBEAD
MSGARAIPGYFYDAERKRYFKIQPNSTGQAAGGAGAVTAAQYTQADVLKRTREQQVAQRAAKAARLETHRNRTATRPPAAAWASVGVVGRAIGLRELYGPGSGALQPNNATTWAVNLRRLDGQLYTTTYRTQTEQMAARGDGTVVQLATVAATGHVLVAEASRLRYYAPTTAGTVVCVDKLPFADAAMPRALCRVGGKIQSVFSGHDLLALTTYDWGESQCAVIHAERLEDAASARPNKAAGTAIVAAGDFLARATVVSPDWTLAMGGQNCVRTFDMTVDGAPTAGHRLHSDVLALEYAGETLLAGLRNGGVVRLDAREPQAQTAVQHRSSVTHLTALRGTYVLAAGLANSLALYDTRFAKPGGHGTRPVLWYPQYVNEHTLDHGYAVNPAGTVVAVAGQDRVVRVYSIWDGGGPLPAAVSGQPFDADVRALAWTAPRAAAAPLPEAAGAGAPGRADPSAFAGWAQAMGAVVGGAAAAGDGLAVASANRIVNWI